MRESSAVISRPVDEGARILEEGIALRPPTSTSRISPATAFPISAARCSTRSMLGLPEVVRPVGASRRPACRCRVLATRARAGKACGEGKLSPRERCESRARPTGGRRLPATLSGQRGQLAPQIRPERVAFDELEPAVLWNDQARRRDCRRGVVFRSSLLSESEHRHVIRKRACTPLRARSLRSRVQAPVMSSSPERETRLRLDVSEDRFARDPRRARSARSACCFWRWQSLAPALGELTTFQILFSAALAVSPSSRRSCSDPGRRRSNAVFGTHLLRNVAHFGGQYAWFSASRSIP